jgi:hypothetical protein
MESHLMNLLKCYYPTVNPCETPDITMYDIEVFKKYMNNRSDSFGISIRGNYKLMSL